MEANKEMCGNPIGEEKCHNEYLLLVRLRGSCLTSLLELFENITPIRDNRNSMM